MYHVESFSVENFCKLLSQYCVETSTQVIETKPHIQYIAKYLQTLNVQTIVVETDYIDHDYLTGFAAYHVKCFYDYKRKCVRLHFFKEAFEQKDLAAFLRGEKENLAENLCNSYGGFMVLHPLPKSIIGRTCLATYDDDSRRHFPTAWPIRAFFCGLELSVKALPFQEQDQVAGACATSALWSAFHATDRLFHHRVPSPVEITSSATLGMPVKSRVFPNKDGLTIEQMAHAIHAVGLEPYWCDLKNQKNLLEFRALVYAYLACGIPPILVIDLTREKSEENNRTSIGWHAVTVTGYSLLSNRSRQHKDGEFLYKSDAIDQIYVHDDQVGPHAKMVFPSSDLDSHLTTSWGLSSGYLGIRAEIVGIVFPLYNKIRIPFSQPGNDIDTFNKALEMVGLPWLTDTLEWDIRLTQVNCLKKEILSSKLTNPDLREKILASPLPRFIWHATATNDSGLVADILFDATDIDSGKYILRIDAHDPSLRELLAYAKLNPTTDIGKIFSETLNKVRTSHVTD